MEHEKVLIIDFGSQYSQLIAGKVRGCNVYAEVKPYKISVEDIRKANPKGIIFTGGPAKLFGESALDYDKKIFELGIPMAAENPKFDSDLDGDKSIGGGDSKNHNDAHSRVSIADSIGGGIEITEIDPEELATSAGMDKLNSFLMDTCGCGADWQISSFVESSIKQIKEQVGDGKVLCALSGGVDSSVSAVLLSKAIGKQLTCVFVDHGLMRKNEPEQVESIFGAEGNYDLNFIHINARQRFYDKLAGVEDPEKKRKIIGEEFIRVFEEEAKKIGAVDFLVQGTIYPDVIESGIDGSAVIKSHHNVGGLPEHVDFKDIIEPLRMLFKGEVREVGKELGLPDYLVNRQPFPGPGLAVRIIGEVNADKVKIVQEADAIYREEIDAAGLGGHPGTDDNIGQYFAALTNLRSVGVKNDVRTYDYAIALRAVKTVDFMTAKAAELPWPVLQKVSTRIVNEVEHVNRVFYDCTSKPPGTIEFE